MANHTNGGQAGDPYDCLLVSLQRHAIKVRSRPKIEKSKKNIVWD